MTNPNEIDPATRNRRLANETSVNSTNYTPWIIGGLAAVALAFGIMFMTGDRTTNAAMNSNRGVTTSAPVTPAPGTTAPAPKTGTAR